MALSTSFSSKSYNFVRLAGAILGGLAVVSGASSAHGSFHDFIAAQGGLDYWQKALTYQWYHALALVAVSSDYKATFSSYVAGNQMFGGRYINLGMPLYAICWITGVVCFSGSLYILAVAPGTSWVAPFTPIGGLLMICGWVLLAWRSRPI